MSHNIGRHRAAGRYNPVSEIGQIVSHAGTPIAKGTAVFAASGGLIAAIAVPAQAADSATVVDSAPVQGHVAGRSGHRTQRHLLVHPGGHRLRQARGHARRQADRPDPRAAACPRRARAGPARGRRR
ncbi:hypothetical protein LP422_03335 [Janibacter limosus]|uniref:Uncharacterized protein n=1 Tax=Janibacter limosus TaxID=53458 RepID=A0AC61U5N1_9MICO|nr:hypothetical protein [Janibacter limosus]UUZ45284.1 hypothetical protein LP422_03335 [Janibacter limosus]